MTNWVSLESYNIKVYETKKENLVHCIFIKWCGFKVAMPGKAQHWNSILNMIKTCKY